MTSTTTDPAAIPSDAPPAAPETKPDPMVAANAARKANAEAREASKKRGERGPDKRPRKRREGGAKASGGAKKAANPLAAAVDGDGKPSGGDVPAGTPRGKLGAPSGGAAARKGTAQELIALSSAELAALTVRLGSAMILKAGTKRYGANAVLLALDDGEEKEITRLTEKVLDKHLIRLEPEWALAITVAVIYAQKIMVAEAAKDTGMSAAQMSAAVQAAAQQMMEDAKAKAAANGVA